MEFLHKRINGKCSTLMIYDGSVVRFDYGTMQEKVE
jgi:hypothetical protein